MGRGEHGAISHSHGCGEAGLLNGGRVRARQGLWRRGLSLGSPTSLGGAYVDWAGEGGSDSSSHSSWGDLSETQADFASSLV